jgi:hypothetical protein
MEKYTITFLFNGETFKKRMELSNELIKKFIDKIKPQLLFTDIYIILSKGTGKNKETNERKINLTQGKRIFSDDAHLDIFINNLIL